MNERKKVQVIGNGLVALGKSINAMKENAQTPEAISVLSQLSELQEEIFEQTLKELDKLDE